MAPGSKRFLERCGRGLLLGLAAASAGFAIEPGGQTGHPPGPRNGRPVAVLQQAFGRHPRGKCAAPMRVRRRMPLGFAAKRCEALG